MTPCLAQALATFAEEAGEFYWMVGRGQCTECEPPFGAAVWAPIPTPEDLPPLLKAQGHDLLSVLQCATDQLRNLKAEAQPAADAAERATA